MLSIDHLNVAYYNSRRTVKVINGISLTLREGESIGIVGESGSGKSQTALSIMRMLQGSPGIVYGDITYKNRELTNLSEQEMRRIRGNEIAIIFQNAKSSLVPYMTIREQVIDTMQGLGKVDGRGDGLGKARELLADMNLENPGGILSRYPNELSGGECQRAYIMLSLLGEPDLLIADEPTSSLDPVSSKKLVDLLKAVCTEHGISLLLISHDLSEVIRATDRIYVYFDGFIVEHFPSEWLHSDSRQPVHPYTRFLFSMYKGEAFLELKRQPAKTVGSDFESVSRPPAGTGGCIYASRCGLRGRLPEELKAKCQSRHPPLESVHVDGQAACWGAKDRDYAAS